MIKEVSPMKRMPALFIGHGSPMLALDHNEMTKTLTELGKRIITDYGRPKAIAVVSAHWYSRGSYVNAAQKPEQIYDMYGFPQALYEVSYPALGDPQTARRIHDLTGAVMTEDWGIDHGVWTLFVHMFPDASLPVVPLSVDGTLSPHDQYAFGEKLAALREEGIVVAGIGPALCRIAENIADGKDFVGRIVPGICFRLVLEGSVCIDVDLFLMDPCHDFADKGGIRKKIQTEIENLSPSQGKVPFFEDSVHDFIR